VHDALLQKVVEAEEEEEPQDEEREFRGPREGVEPGLFVF
jgi:hypothetical protein